MIITSPVKLYNYPLGRAQANQPVIIKRRDVLLITEVLHHSDHDDEINKSNNVNDSNDDDDGIDVIYGMTLSLFLVKEY